MLCMFRRLEPDYRVVCAMPEWPVLEYMCVVCNVVLLCFDNTNITNGNEDGIGRTHQSTCTGQCDKQSCCGKGALTYVEI